MKNITSLLIFITLTINILFVTGCNKKDKSITLSNIENYEWGIKQFNLENYERAKLCFVDVVPVVDSISYDSIYNLSKAYIKLIGGINLMKSNSFDDAMDNFNSIKEYKYSECLDSLVESWKDNMSDAKENYVIKEKTKLALAKEKEKESLKQDKIKSALEKKYKRIFEGRGWLSEKQSKLMKYNFSEYKSGYEKAGDGSEQIAMYYQKYEDGFTVHVRLQYAYSIEYHYSRVWVE